MMTNFENITPSEFDSLKNALLQITVLIAGADGRIDASETDWAEKLTEIRGYAHKEDLREFYDEVHIDFQTRLQQLIAELPADVETRNSQISATLSALNPILAKLDNKIGFELYTSLVSFAKHIAQSSGGIMRFMSISKAEEEWISLPMLTPIVLEEEEEESAE
jgi:hypothetical protein